ncbi:MAG TPA: peptidyl-prolyl cis-trans isomerase [Alphaproteobacteria bacterium]|nr:peptidyl-prolyl cis-trans isomerase [Alphaproteobacteria bacterium]
MKTSLLKSISLIAFLAVSSPVLAADPVVGVVNGHKFTYSQVMETKASLPKQYQSAPDDKLFPVLLNQLVDTYLIGEAAQASGEAQKPEVQKAIAKATEGIIAQAYLLDKVKGTITDAAVQAKYAEVIKNFPQEKEVHLKHILVDSKETAQSIIKALKGGADFKKLAQAKSKDETAKEGGDLGFFRKSELPKELADAAFALTAGSYSQEPVKTDFGWHVLKVEEFRDAKPPKFEEVQSELKSLMTQEAVVALVKDLRSKAKVELFDKNGKPLPKESEKKPEAEAPKAPTTGEESKTPETPAAPLEVKPIEKK